MDEMENFPRFRNDNIGINDFVKVDGFEQGRPDLIARRNLGGSRMAKALCAVNHIRNPMPLRDSVRLFTESLYNELYMKGLRDDELEAEFQNQLNEISASNKLWRFYNNLSEGVVAEVGFGRTLGIPTLGGILQWIKTYDKTIK